MKNAHYNFPDSNIDILMSFFVQKPKEKHINIKI